VKPRRVYLLGLPYAIAYIYFNPAPANYVTSLKICSSQTDTTIDRVILPNVTSLCIGTILISYSTYCSPTRIACRGRALGTGTGIQEPGVPCGQFSILFDVPTYIHIVHRYMSVYTILL